MTTTDDPPGLGIKGLGMIDADNYTLVERAGGDGSWPAVVRYVLAEDATRTDGFGLDGDVRMGEAIVDDAMKAIRYAWQLAQEQLHKRPDLVDGPWVHTTRIVDAGIHAIVLRSRLLGGIQLQIDPTGCWALEHQPLDSYDGNHSKLVDDAWEGMSTRGLEPRAVLWRKQAALVASPIRWYRRVG